MQFGRRSSFIIIFTTILFVVCLGIFLLMRHLVLQEYLVYNMHFISQSVRHEAEESLTPEDFTRMDAETRARFDAYFESVPERHELVHIKVWAKNGTIIHSDQEELVGRSFPLHEEFLRSMGGTTVSELYPIVELYAARGDDPLIETYVPIIMEVDGQETVVGVIEVYQSVEVFDAMYFRLLLYIALIMAAATLLLLPILAYLHHRFIRDAEEQATRLAVANRDLAIQKEELAAAYTQLQAFDHTKDKFISHVNHEIRTPLTAIKAYVEFIADGDKGPITADQKESLEIIKESVATMETTINNLLDVAKMEEGKQHFDMRTVPIAEIINPVIAEFRPLADKKRIALTCTVPVLPPIRCDAHRMRGVVRNLLSNAVKYTPAGGEIMVAAKQVENVIAISVTDTGIGIKEEDIPLLFDRFSRTSKQGLTGEASSGLGLSIVKQIVERHGGAISVQSVVGRGTTFTVRIALAQPEA